LLRALAAERRRFGYRRLREMARRKGNVMNLKKVYRLYREEGLIRGIGKSVPICSRRSRWDHVNKSHKSHFCGWCILATPSSCSFRDTVVLHSGD
jgi:hypothetical protein